MVKFARFSTLHYLKLRGSLDGLTVDIETDPEPLRNLSQVKYLVCTISYMA